MADYVKVARMCNEARAGNVTDVILETKVVVYKIAHRLRILEITIAH